MLSVCSFGSDVPTKFESQQITLRLFNKKREFCIVEFMSTPLISSSFDSAPSPDTCKKISPASEYTDEFLFSRI